MREKNRQANFELLRIIAMMMVVTMHYLMKGDVAVSMAEDGSVVNLLTWFLESVCIVAVNVYVLISGYFLVKTEWKISRLWKLILQIWCYSVGVPVVCLLLGVGNVASWSIYDWAAVLFPLQMEHYWFATAYVVMYLLVPVLSMAVKKMEKRQLQITILLLVLYFSIGKSVIPILIPTDRYGYDFGWFICLFLISAYIRLYGSVFFNHKKKSLIVYFVFTVVIFVLSAGFGWLTREKGLPLSYAMDMVHCYNHILVLAASVALFCGFMYLRIPKGIVSNIVCGVAPYTFGVYLLHENIAVRLLWQSWAGVESVKGSWRFLPHMAVTVLLVFMAGILIDFIRNYCFEKTGKLVKNSSFMKK